MATDPVVLRWLSAEDDLDGDPPEARCGHIAVAVENRDVWGEEFLIVHGGINPSREALGDTVALQASQSTWLRPVPPGSTQPPARAFHCACAVGSTLYLFGGHVFVRSQQRISHFDDLWSLDTGSWEWRRIELDPRLPRPCARDRASLVALHDGKLLLFGGANTHSRRLDDAWIIDPRGVAGTASPRDSGAPRSASASPADPAASTPVTHGAPPADLLTGSPPSSPGGAGGVRSPDPGDGRPPHGAALATLPEGASASPARSDGSEPPAGPLPFWREVAAQGTRPRARCCSALASLGQRVLAFGGDASGAVGDVWSLRLGAERGLSAGEGASPALGPLGHEDGGRGSPVLDPAAAAGSAAASAGRPPRSIPRPTVDGHWTSLTLQGPAPTPRRGHAIALSGRWLVLSGGVTEPKGLLGLKGRPEHLGDVAVLDRGGGSVRWRGSATLGDLGAGVGGGAATPDRAPTPTPALAPARPPSAPGAPPAPVPPPREKHSIAALSDGRMLLFGGTDGHRTLGDVWWLRIEESAPREGGGTAPPPPEPWGLPQGSSAGFAPGVAGTAKVRGGLPGATWEVAPGPDRPALDLLTPSSPSPTGASPSPVGPFAPPPAAAQRGGLADAPVGTARKDAPPSVAARLGGLAGLSAAEVEEAQLAAALAASAAEASDAVAGDEDALRAVERAIAAADERARGPDATHIVASRPARDPRDASAPFADSVTLPSPPATAAAARPASAASAAPRPAPVAAPAPAASQAPASWSNAVTAPAASLFTALPAVPAGFTSAFGHLRGKLGLPASQPAAAPPPAPPVGVLASAFDPALLELGERVLARRLKPDGHRPGREAAEGAPASASESEARPAAGSALAPPPFRLAAGRTPGADEATPAPDRSALARAAREFLATCDPEELALGDLEALTRDYARWARVAWADAVKAANSPGAGASSDPPDLGRFLHVPAGDLRVRDISHLLDDYRQLLERRG